MSQAEMIKLGIAAAIIFAGYKYGSGVVKGAAVAVGAVMVAKRVPYLKEAI